MIDQTESRGVDGMITDAMVEAAALRIATKLNLNFSPKTWVAARTALEAAERAAWIKAEELPREFEGKPAWLWSPGAEPTIGHAPRDYSRESRHCGGLMVMPLTVPEPPQCD